MFETAVIEIAANIVRHGSDEGRTLCNLILEVYPNRLDAHFRDDVNIDAAAMPDSFAESGRGLAIAKAAVDVLTYERQNDNNIWTISRTRTVDGKGSNSQERVHEAGPERQLTPMGRRDEAAC